MERMTTEAVSVVGLDAALAVDVDVIVKMVHKVQDRVHKHLLLVFAYILRVWPLNIYVF